MDRAAHPAIRDLLQTIGRVQTRFASVSFFEFQADWELQFILQRAIEIISEASRRVPEELKKTQPDVRWRSIAAIGNVLRHEYHTVSDKIIWDVAQRDLPQLRAALEAMQSFDR
jgi:uncharacterized protein with HEPN domain